MQNRDRDELASETRLNGALVVSTSFENWMRLKQFAEEIGCRILYQKSAPTWVFLKVIQDERRDGP